MPLLPLDLRRQRFDKAQRLKEGWLQPNLAEVEATQLTRLNSVWQDAVADVPYYRELARRRTLPNSFVSVREFVSTVPVLTRAEILAQPELFVREGRPPDRRAMTAGSTGNPLHFGVYKEESEHVAPDLVLGRLANGLEASDRVFLLWGHSHLLGTGFKGKGKHALRRVKDRVLGYRRVDAYHLDQASAQSHLRRMLDFRPKAVIGYSSALDLLVRYNQDLAPQVRELKLKFVVGTAENLPRTDSKVLIESFFGCPFVMEYGGVEFGSVAHNRPGEGYNVYWWNSLVETLEERGTAAEDSKPIAVTALYKRYFPVIRYRNGDEIRGAQRLSEVQVVKFDEVCGRHNDAITLDDGSAIHSVGLFHCIHQEPQVFNIQLIIESQRLRLLLVASNSDDKVAQRIRKRLHDLNPALASCAIEFVPDLVTNRAGKRRWVIDAR